MTGSYRTLLERIARESNVSVEEAGEWVASRRARAFGLIGKGVAARTIVAQLAVSSYLAAGARHVSGLTVADALATAAKEAASGHLSTLGYWPAPKEAPAAVADHYLRAIEGISGASLTSSISIKADRLEYRREVLLPVLKEAIRCRVRVHFDAQGFDTAERTLALVEDALAVGADVSATLPSRWRRSVADAERYITLGIPFRIVKGQGGDPGTPGIDPRRSFLELVRQVCGRASHVGIATHDRRTAEPALDMLLAAGTPCSLEQLRSLPRIDFLAQRRGLPVRAYVAYGRYGLPYAVEEVMRRPAIIGWILRDLLVRRR